MRLNDMIRQLEACNPDARVYYNFGGTFPTTIDSWRGVYAELALGWGCPYNKATGTNATGEPPTVAALVAELKSAIGKTFEGYKGGQFLMQGHTQVHCDNYGTSTGTSIVGIRDDGYAVTILTANMND